MATRAAVSIAALSLGLSSLVAQQTLRVGPARPFRTIQAAIDSALAWDRVLVDTGTYDEGLTIGKGIYVDCAGSTVRGPVRFVGIPTGQRAHFQGARIASAHQDPRPAQPPPTR